MARSLTKHRKLRSGASPWGESSRLAVATRSLARDAVADVAIVGTGISGALMAQALSARGLRVVLLDRRAQPFRGSTMASTALLQYELDVPLTVLSERVGVARAQRAWLRSWQAIRALGQLIKRTRIACEWTECKSLYLAGTSYGSRALAKEAVVRSRIGLPGRMLSRTELRARFGIERTGAIESEDAARVNPAQLTAGLLRRVVASGAHIYIGADVQEVSTGRQMVVLGVAGGQSIVARAAVFCTGYELPNILPLHGQRIRSTWALATKPLRNIPRWLRRTLVWEASHPYLYVRSTTNGGLMAGGEDENSATRHLELALLPAKTDRIARKVSALLPGVSMNISHRWAGAFGESPTGMPVIGALPNLRNCFSVTGFGGNGITHSMIAAQILSAEIAGKSDPDARVFRAA